MKFIQTPRYLFTFCTHLSSVWILMKVTASFFFSLFLRSQFSRALHYSMSLVHGSWIPQISFFTKIFFKNESHDTIHIFKNYFVIIFSVFNKINNITHPSTTKNTGTVKKNQPNLYATKYRHIVNILILLSYSTTPTVSSNFKCTTISPTQMLRVLWFTFSCLNLGSILISQPHLLLHQKRKKKKKERQGTSFHVCQWTSDKLRCNLGPMVESFLRYSQVQCFTLIFLNSLV